MVPVESTPVTTRRFSVLRRFPGTDHRMTGEWLGGNGLKLEWAWNDLGDTSDEFQTDRRMQGEDGKSRGKGYSRWGTRGNPFGIRTLNEWKSTLSKIFPAESAPVTSKWYSSGLLPLPLSYLFLRRVFRMIGVIIAWADGGSGRRTEGQLEML